MGWLKDYLMRLTDRERTIVIFGGLAALTIVVWALLVNPMFEKAQKLEKRTANKQSEATELAQVLGEYLQVKETMGEEVAAAPDPNFSLLSFLEGLARRNQVKDNIKYMRPTTADVTDRVREHAVEVKIDGIRLADAVQLMTAMEKAPHGLRVKQLHMKRRFSNANLLDVTFSVARYEEI